MIKRHFLAVSLHLSIPSLPKYTCSTRAPGCATPPIYPLSPSIYLQHQTPGLSESVCWHLKRHSLVVARVERHILLWSRNLVHR